MSYLLYGQNPVGLDERITQLRSQLDSGGLGTTIIDVQSSTLQEIASAVQAMPFFGGSRVVVLLQPIAAAKRGATVDDDSEASEETAKIKWADLAALLKSVPATTEVLLRHDGSLTATHYLHKAAKTLGWKLESFGTLRGQELLQWQSQRVAERGGRIDQHAAVMMLNRLFPQSWNNQSNYAVAPDLRLLATEIDKLIVAAGDDGISSRLIEDLVVDREGFTAFKLNDQTFSGNAAGALKELSDVLDADQHPEMVISQTAGEAIGLHAITALQEYGTKEVARVSGISEGRLGNLQKRNIPPVAQRRIAESLRTAGAAMRSTESNAPAVITPLVAEIAEAVRLSRTERRRS